MGDTNHSDPLKLLRFIKGRKVKRISVNKIQNEHAVVSDGFVIICMFYLVIECTQQRAICIVWRMVVIQAGRVLPYVDSRLCSINDIVFEQGAVMPKLTPMTISNKCLRIMNLGFTCGRPELVTQNVAYIPNCSAIH